MICDLLSHPLPENTAVCSASWMLSHSQPICLAYPVLPCPARAQLCRLNAPLTPGAPGFHIVYHWQRHWPAPNCFFDLTCHISLGIIPDRHPPSTVFPRRLP